MAEALSFGYESHTYRSLRKYLMQWFEAPYNEALFIKQSCSQHSKKDRWEALYNLFKHQQHYFRNDRIRFVWRGRIGYTVWKKTESECVHLFTSDKWTNLVVRFIESKFGTVEDAIMSTEDFNELWNLYEYWFDEKREKFMENMSLDIQKASALSNKKLPQSHGGVANLLKILTKTMDRQGADIRSIAKVQYAICVQAGIYIPDEFIRDVAVALDIEEGNL